VAEMPPTKKRENSEKYPIPTRLYNELIKIQAADELSWNDACEKAANLLDSNSKMYKNAVAAEADRLYKSRFMTQLNKTRADLNMKGYQEGFADAAREYETWGFCSVCGEKMTISPNSDEHKAIIDYLRKIGWSHGHCSQ
jgi:hypothetical protein